MGGSKKQTVGYRYFAGMHMVLCHGPIDALTEITVDEKQLWAGFATGSNADAATGWIRVLQQPVPLYNSVVVAGTTFTFVTSGGGGSTQVLIGATVNDTAATLASKINALALVNATVSGNQVNIVAAASGGAGNDIGLQVRNTFLGANRLSASGATLSGGGGSLDINRGDLFGGESREGGISGRLDFLAGRSTQLPNDYLVSRLGALVPAFRGVASVVLRQMYLSMNPYLKTWAFRAQRIHVRDDGVAQWADHLAQIDLTVYDDAGNAVTVAAMNPAHIMRECLTNRLWGLGYNEADIDDASFLAAAQIFFDEKMGMCLLWDTQKSIEDFMKIVQQHVDAAVFTDRRTGLFTITAIRGDYDEDTLLTLDPSNIDKIEDFKRPTFGELCTSVTVNYWDYLSDKTASVTIAEIALEQEQGEGGNNTTVTYENFADPATASKAAQRDLRSLSTPLIACTIYATKVARNLRVGSVFKLTWPDYQIADVVMRVTGIAYGNGKTRRVQIKCAQDVFGYPDDAFVTLPPSGWVDPSGPPSPVIYQQAFEMPYFELVRESGQTTVDSQIATNPYIGYVGAAAAQPPSSNVINANVYTDDGSGYEDVAALEFCAGAILVGDIGFEDTVLNLTGLQSATLIAANEWVQVGTELMGVVSLVGNVLTVKRGVLDTTPREHVSGAVVLAWDGLAAIDPTEYVSSDIVSVKITPTNGSGVVPLDDAEPMTVNVVGRAARPFPPANVLIDGFYRPAVALELPFPVTWVGRNRIVQTGGTLIGYFDGAVTPEDGTTYNLRVYDATMSLLYTESSSGGTITITTAKIGSVSEIYIELFSERDGLASMETQTFYVQVKSGIPGDELFFVMDDLSSPPLGGAINFEMGA